jgi:hypothetical protein
MAIYHLHAQIIGRSAGQSAVAAAAYRSTSRLVDRSTGVECDYTRKTKAVSSAILTPIDTPEWAKNREELWNRVQEKENRKNSQFAREIDVAIPYELKQNGELAVKNFCKMFTNRGLVCDYAIHKPDRNGDNRNEHAHIMITTRKLTSKGWGEKDREANDKDFLLEVRKYWEICANSELKKLYVAQRIAPKPPLIEIDCRSLKDQGIDREPQRHQGKYATRLERKKQAIESSQHLTNEQKTKMKAAINIKRGKFAGQQEQIPVEPEQLKQLESAEQLLTKEIEFLEMPKSEWAEKHPKLEKQILESEQISLIFAIKKHLPEIQEKFRQDGIKLKDERELLEKVSLVDAKKAAKEILELGNIQKKHRPDIFEKIQTSQQEFFKKTEFYNLKFIVAEVQAARAETDRRERIAQQQSSASRQKPHSRGR